MALLNMSSRRRAANLAILLALIALSTVFLVRTSRGSSALGGVKEAIQDLLPGKPAPTAYRKTYKPTPTYTPPAVRDPFPLLATSTPPPVPPWNVPRRPDAHAAHSLPVPPPLLIGFTRGWPLLLQCVTSYLAAGWPASQIFVVENTGAQQANARGQLSPQHPLFLNHTVLAGLLGVSIVQTPALLSFAQLQNFYLSLTYARGWDYFFWSHADVLALGYEAGEDGVSGPATADGGYKPLYELCLEALAEARGRDARWGLRFFAYDHLTLVNPRALEDVGGWDTLIPYYMTDCDMHTRLAWAGWSIADSKAGIITDVSTVLTDLAALYRVPGAEVDFADPNPPPPAAEKTKNGRRAAGPEVGSRQSVRRGVAPETRQATGDNRTAATEADVEYFRSLQQTADRMFHYKHGERGRNTWQASQRGGFGEPFYYPADGMTDAVEILTEAGREVFRRKWGHRDCDLAKTDLETWDQWRVEKDWRD